MQAAVKRYLTYVRTAIDRLEQLADRGRAGQQIGVLRIRELIASYLLEPFDNDAPTSRRQRTIARPIFARPGVHRTV